MGRGLDDNLTNGQTDANRRDVTDHGRRLTTKTKLAFKTTEFVAYVVVLAGILNRSRRVAEPFREPKADCTNTLGGARLII